MSVFVNVIRLQLNKTKSSRAYFIALLIGLLFILLAVSSMKFSWDGNRLAGVYYIIDFEAGFFRSMFVLVQHLIFFCLVFAAGVILVINKTGGEVPLLFTKPVHPFQLISWFWLGSSLLVFLPLAVIHTAFWICFGVIYGVWSITIFTSLIPLCIISLLINSTLLFFAVISRNPGNAVFYTLIYCLILPSLLGAKEKLFMGISGTMGIKNLVNAADLLIPDTGKLLELSVHIFSGGNSEYAVLYFSLLYISSFMAGALYFSRWRTI